MGKLALRGLESNLQVELCPSSRLSVSGHSSSRASPTGPESQPASPTHPTTLPSLQLVIEEKVQAIRFPEYLPYLHAYSVPRLSFRLVSTLETCALSPLRLTLPLGDLPTLAHFSFIAPYLLRVPARIMKGTYLWHAAPSPCHCLRLIWTQFPISLSVTPTSLPTSYSPSQASIPPGSKSLLLSLLAGILLTNPHYSSLCSQPPLKPLSTRDSPPTLLRPVAAS